MKRFGFVALALAIALLSVVPVCAAPIEPAKFPAWMESDGLWRTIPNGSFKEGAQFAPTDAQLKTILHFSSLTPTSGGKTDYFLLLLKDVAQQVDVVGKGNAHSGTATVLVFGDRLLATDVSAAKTPQQLDRGYYDVGIASGYLNVAAVSQGLGTHFFMTTQYASATARPVSIEDTYLKGKGYSYTNGLNNKALDPYGNTKFVCAIVIGTLNEQAQSKVTTHAYPENWAVAK